MALEGPFIENLGQVDDPRVRYCAYGDPLSVALTQDGALFALRGEGTGMAVVRMSLDGSRPVDPAGTGAIGPRTSFFLGDDPARWARGARGFGEVLYGDVLDGVDLRFGFRGGMLKYELILDAGVDPDGLVMRYEGLDGLTLDAETGELLLATAVGVLRDSRPLVLQDGIEGGAPASFRLLADGGVGFCVPESVSRERPMVIDPGLQWSTYLGGRGNDWSSALVLDGDGNVVVTGPTASTDFPTTPGAYDRTGNFTTYWDLFVTAISPDGSRVVWSTFIGGTGGEEAMHMVRDRNGDLLIVGETGSYNFPTTPTAINRTSNGRTDAFLLKLADGGTELLYATYIGGPSVERARGLALDGDGNVLVTGYTWSYSFPVTQGAFCTTYGGRGDAFVLKVSSDLDELSYSTFIGGGGDDNGTDIAVDASGNAYVCGYTDSDFFPTTTGAYMTTKAAEWYYAFVCCLPPEGDRLVSSTVLGGYGATHAYGIMLATNGSIVMTGDTSTSDFPLTGGAICATRGGEYDCFVSILDGDLGALQYSTLMGGGDTDAGAAVAWGAQRRSVVVVGATRSKDIRATVGSYDPTARGESDLLLFSIDLTTMGLGYCTYVGGSSYDGVAFGGLATDADGAAYITGAAWSKDFPTTEGAYCRTYGGGWTDSYVFKLDPVGCAIPKAPTGLTAEGGDANVTLTWDRPPFEGCRVLRQRVFRGTSPSTVEPLTDIAASAAGYVDAQAVNGVRYYYRVSVTNTAGEGPWSAMVTAVPIGLPAEPLNVSASTGDGKVRLNWSPPAWGGGGEILGYIVLRGVDAQHLVPVATLGDVLTFEDADVVKGGEYVYAVRAFNERGEGPLSATIGIVPMSPPGPPSAFDAVVVGSEAHLSWGLPVDSGGSRILGFHVYKGSTPDGLLIIANLLPNERSYVDADLESGMGYYYAVSAISAFAEGELTETILISFVPITPPGAPRGLEVEVGDGWALLGWEPPSSDGGRPVTGYVIYVKVMSRTLTLTVGNVTEYLHSDLVNGAVHSYEVAAVNEVGQGPRCGAVEATPMGLPGVPLDLRATVGPEGVRLTWDPPESSGGAATLTFTVLRGPSSTALVPIAEALGATEHLDTTVERGVLYLYAVVAVNTVGPGPQTEHVGVPVPGILAPVQHLAADWGNGKVRLSWSPPSDDGGLAVTGYIVLRGENATALSELTTLGPVLDHTDPGLENGVTYFYAIKAVNAWGPGALSPIVSATPLGPPGEVAELVAKVKDGDLVLTWAPPSGAATAPITGYIVLRGESESSLEPIAELGLVLTYKDASAKAGRTYYYSVTATSAVGNGTRATPAKAKLQVEEPGLTAGAAIAAVAVATLAHGTLATGRAPRDCPRGRTGRPGR